MHLTSKPRTLFLLFLATFVAAAAARDALPDHGVIGVEPAHLTPDYWIAKQPHSDAVLIDLSGIAEQNARLRRVDPSVNDIAALPAELERSRVRDWIESLSRLPDAALYDEEGKGLTREFRAALRASLALDSIPARQGTRYGLITQRADLRTFPTRRRVFNAPGTTDIDRFQESALFPGTPVAIVHESADAEWRFVVSDVYEAWVEQRHVAVGSAAAVFGYARKEPYLVVTGSEVRTNFTPGQPQVSELGLEMGVRVPVVADWPTDRLVNGQHPSAAHVIELPIRARDGELDRVPALLARSVDAATGYLPFTRENLLRQGFKFLGERYGWGHSYNARDCSGFVSEVYRSLGVTLPRNTGDQARSPAIHRVALGAGKGHSAILEALRTLEVGDLIHVPGHVMMFIGFDRGSPHVIHDTAGINYRDADGKLKRLPVNGVVVTSLTTMRSDDDRPIIDRISSIQRIRP